MSTTTTAPAVNLDEGPALTYRRHLKAGHLSFQRCDACGRAVFHPRAVCHVCGGRTLGWEHSAGRGTVYSMSTLYPHDVEPYTVALVDLDEGFRMMTCVEAGQGPVRIGMRVGVRIAEAADGFDPLAVFQPLAEESA